MLECIIITPRVLHYCANYSAYLMGTTVINIFAPVGGEDLAWVRGTHASVRAQTLDKAGHRL